MSNVLKKSSGLLFFFIFISCSNPLAGPDLSIYDTSSNEYYVTDLTDFSDGKDLEVICFDSEVQIDNDSSTPNFFREMFEHINGNTTYFDPCYDFALVEDLYIGDPLPSAAPVAFIDNRDDKYLKGSNLFTARMNSFRVNFIPILWIIPLIIVYFLFAYLREEIDIRKIKKSQEFAKTEEE